MVLTYHSNTGYLNKSGARKHTVGQQYLSASLKFPNTNPDKLNDTKIIKAVISLAVEVELGELFINAKKTAETCNILTKMGHLQPQHPCKLTIRLMKPSSISMPSPSVHKQWTCGSTGFGTHLFININSGNVANSGHYILGTTG